MRLLSPGCSGPVLESPGEGEADELDAVVQVQLAEGVLDVVLHGAVREDELGGDLLVGHAGRDEAQDLGGRAVVPGFVDSHAHLVFAGDRSEEFAARMTGRPYEAGGIRTTVAATRAASDEQLAANLARLLAEMHRQGTTTVEVKSGYGLTVRDEARSLAIARQAVALLG